MAKGPRLNRSSARWPRGRLRKVLAGVSGKGECAGLARSSDDPAGSQACGKNQIDFWTVSFSPIRSRAIKPSRSFSWGVLPFSSYFFGEFVLDQKLPTFIGVQSRMFAYFGGILPTWWWTISKRSPPGRSVTRNPTYCDFANHMGFAVLPARPQATRQGLGGMPHRSGPEGFFQEVRNRVFYSLQELQSNAQGLSLPVEPGRDERLRGESLPALRGREKQLKPLPGSPFELSEWRRSQSPSRLPYPGGEKHLGPLCLCRPKSRGPALRKSWKSSAKTTSPYRARKTPGASDSSPPMISIIQRPNSAWRASKFAAQHQAKSAPMSRS